MPRVANHEDVTFLPVNSLIDITSWVSFSHIDRFFEHRNKTMQN